MLKLVLGLFLVLGFAGFSLAQPIIEIQTYRLEYAGKQYTGRGVMIELEKKFVNEQVDNFLKPFGKIETQKNSSLKRINNALIPDFGNKPAFLLAKTETGTQGINFILALKFDSTDWQLDTPDDEILQKMLQKFALNAYKEDLNKEILDLDRAIDKAVKDHDRKVLTGSNLAKSLEKNRFDKAKLEKALVDNAAERTRLKRDSVNNIAEKDYSLDEISKLRKMSEEKKNKLSDFR